jgi:hypothetical protein
MAAADDLQIDGITLPHPATLTIYSFCKLALKSLDCMTAPIMLDAA